jgi:hypothetical protein
MVPTSSVAASWLVVGPPRVRDHHIEQDGLGREDVT